MSLIISSKFLNIPLRSQLWQFLLRNEQKWLNIYGKNDSNSLVFFHKLLSSLPAFFTAANNYRPKHETYWMWWRVFPCYWQHVFGFRTESVINKTLCKRTPSDRIQGRIRCVIAPLNTTNITSNNEGEFYFDVVLYDILDMSFEFIYSFTLRLHREMICFEVDVL